MPIRAVSSPALCARCRTFHETLTMIAADWKECANDPFGMHMTTSKATMSYRVSNAIIGFHMVAVMTYSFSVFLSDVENGDFNVSIARAFIIKMELPFDSNSSPVYELVMVVQFFQLMSNACAIDVLNALILTLVSHVSVGGNVHEFGAWIPERRLSSSRDI